MVILIVNRNIVTSTFTVVVIAATNQRPPPEGSANQMPQRSLSLCEQGVPKLPPIQEDQSDCASCSGLSMNADPDQANLCPSTASTLSPDNQSDRGFYSNSTNNNDGNSSDGINTIKLLKLENNNKLPNGEIETISLKIHKEVKRRESDLLPIFGNEYVSDSSSY